MPVVARVPGVPKITFNSEKDIAQDVLGDEKLATPAWSWW